MEGSLPFPFVLLALVGGWRNRRGGGGCAAYSAKQTKWKEDGATIDHLRERIRYRADGWIPWQGTEGSSCHPNWQYLFTRSLTDFGFSGRWAGISGMVFPVPKTSVVSGKDSRSADSDHRLLFCPLARWKLPKQWRDRELAKAKHHPPNAASFFLPRFHFRVLQKYNLNEPNGVFD